MHTPFFISATRLIETAIAIGLLLRFSRRRITYFAGALFSLLNLVHRGRISAYLYLWRNQCRASGYMYCVSLPRHFQHLLSRDPYSLDYIGSRYPKWASLVEWAPKRSMQPPRRSIGTSDSA